MLCGLWLALSAMAVTYNCAPLPQNTQFVANHIYIGSPAQTTTPARQTNTAVTDATLDKHRSRPVTPVDPPEIIGLDEAPDALVFSFDTPAVESKAEDAVPDEAPTDAHGEALYEQLLAQAQDGINADKAESDETENVAKPEFKMPPLPKPETTTGKPDMAQLQAAIASLTQSVNALTQQVNDLQETIEQITEDGHSQYILVGALSADLDE